MLVNGLVVSVICLVLAEYFEVVLIITFSTAEGVIV